jgi:hypothetical protein
MTDSMVPTAEKAQQLPQGPWSSTGVVQSVPWTFLQSTRFGRFVAFRTEEALNSGGGMRDSLPPRYLRLSSGDRRLMGVSPDVQRAPLL